VKAIIVGAGLAGLVAARTLYRAGWEVVVLEASDGIGGRVRTEVVDGFKLDRGFQMLFTAYPAVHRQLDLKALKLRRFDVGAVVVEGGRWNELGHPWRDLKALAPTIASGVGSPADKLKLLRLLREPQTPRDLSSAEFLRAYGFSERFIDLLLGGLAGLLTFDRALAVDASAFLSDLYMLAQGRAAVPTDGMQAIPQQIARDLPEGAVRLATPALRVEGAGVISGSESFEGDVVVLAAHSPEVERLSGLSMPKEANSATCLWFHLPYPLYGHKKVVLNGYPDVFVSHAVQISNVAASYAPSPEHLLCAMIPGAPDMTVEQLTEWALEDMQRWFRWRRIGGLKPIAVYQMPFARLAQPPGFRSALPGNRTSTNRLYLAGEYTEGSSINGALLSGQKAAQAILEDYAGG
jgi:phytoene dehydrogenase-like protein